LAEEAAAEGKDWEEQLEQQAREKQHREQLGLPDPAALAPAAQQQQEQPANA
jgi:capsid protein